MTVCIIILSSFMSSSIKMKQSNESILQIRWIIIGLVEQCQYHMPINILIYTLTKYLLFKYSILILFMKIWWVCTRN
jgi:hypothetical protein